MVDNYPSRRVFLSLHPVIPPQYLFLDGRPLLSKLDKKILVIFSFVIFIPICTLKNQAPLNTIQNVTSPPDPLSCAQERGKYVRGVKPLYKYAPKVSLRGGEASLLYEAVRKLQFLVF
jgi:hypothetical protein